MFFALEGFEHKLVVGRCLGRGLIEAYAAVEQRHCSQGHFALEQRHILNLGRHQPSIEQSVAHLVEQAHVVERHAIEQSQFEAVYLHPRLQLFRQNALCQPCQIALGRWEVGGNQEQEIERDDYRQQGADDEP